MPCKNERTPQKIEHMPEDISIVFLFEFPTRGDQKEMMSENVCRELLLIQTPTSLSLSPTCIGCCFIVMENAYIHACMHMHGIAAYGGWGSCMVCGVTTPTNHMAKVESPPKDSRGVRKKERKKGVCVPLVWELGGLALSFIDRHRRVGNARCMSTG
jgi:hypothetical protein